MRDKKPVLVIAVIAAIIVAVAAFLAVAENTSVNEIGRAFLVSAFGGVLGFCTTILIARMLTD